MSVAEREEMITPIKTMTINQIVERKDDLLVSVDDIKEMAKNERNKAIDDFEEKLCNEVESFTATVESIELDFVSLDYLIEFAYEVSKQLKSRTEL